MADDPADVGGCPERVAGPEIVDRVHRPVERDQIAAGVAHDALRHARRAGGIENIERIGRGEVGAGRPPARRFGGVDERGPVAVARRVHLRPGLRALMDDADGGLVASENDRKTSRGLYSTIRPGLIPQLAVRRPWLGVVDAGR